MSEHVPTPESCNDISATRTPVEVNRRLVPEATGRFVGISEYYDLNLECRLIELAAEGVQASRHTNLLERRVSVFSSLYFDNEHLQLIVPEGARTVSQSLKFIARDINSYAEIFDQLGDLLRDLEEKGAGMPFATEDRELLDSIVFASDDTVAFGTRLYLAPPYALDPVQSIDDVTERITNELSVSGYFDAPAVNQLKQAMKHGYIYGN